MTATITVTYLGKYMSNLEHFEFRAACTVIRLVYTVRNDYVVQRTCVDTINGIATEHTVGDKCNDPRRAFLFQKLGCTRDGVGCVGKVIDEDGGAACDIANQHHRGILPVSDLGRATLLQRGQRGGDCYRHIAMGLALWIRANGMPRESATAVALFAPPASGLTMTACW